MNIFAFTKLLSGSLLLSAFVVLATIVIIWALRNTHLLAFLNCMVRVSFWVAVIPASVLIALIFLSPALFEYAPPKQSLDESPIAKDSAQAPPQQPEASSDHDQNKAQQVATPEDNFDTDARTAQRIGPVLTTSGEPAMDSKLERTIIPRLALEDATVREAVMYLKEASARFDPDGASGINIGLTLDANSASRTLSLKRENITLKDALFYVAALAELSVVAMPSGLVIKPAKYAPLASQDADSVGDQDLKADRETTHKASNRIEELIAQAKEGDADSAYYLGKRYWDGEGVGRDYSEALSWYALAADLGHARAPFGVGRGYEQGKGVALDAGEAAEWYREGAERGDGRAYDRLRSLVGRGEVSDTYMDGLVDIHRAMSERDSGTFRNEEDVARFRVQQAERQQRESSRIATEQRNIARSRQNGINYYRRQSENAKTQDGRNYWNKYLNRQIDSRDRDMRNVR